MAFDTGDDPAGEVVFLDFGDLITLGPVHYFVAVTSGELHDWPVSIAPYETLPADVEDYCEQNGILGELPRVLEMVVSSFDSVVEGPSVYVVHDVDSGESWVSIEIHVEGDVAQILEQYERYTDLRLDVPLSARRRIRLAYSRAP